MKKALIGILIMAMAISMAACGSAETAADASSALAESETPETAEEQTESTEQTESNPAEPEFEDIYGFGMPVSDINWDAVIYDITADRMEDGWPSAYQNLAQTVIYGYSRWKEDGWHKSPDGMDDSFLDALADANLSNKEIWENYDENFDAEIYDLIGPKADAPFSIDDETKHILLLLDELSMEQLAALVEEPELQKYPIDDWCMHHNTKLAENIEILAAMKPLSEADEYRAYVENRTEDDLAAEAESAGLTVEEYKPLVEIMDPIIIAGLERGASDEEIQAEIDEALEAYMYQMFIEQMNREIAAEQPATSLSQLELALAAENDLTVEQYEAIKPIVDSIAANAMATGTTDLDHVRAASKAIYNTYVVNAAYGYEGNYSNPYGLLIEGNYSCAGTTKTMALVLYLMGYTDITYYNHNAWAHQWVTVTLDGQPGWAECMGGIADYGEYPFPCYNPGGTYTDPETGLVWQLGGYEG